jgi:polysaccharide pyruvyl transferase WcaK-like protein
MQISMIAATIYGNRGAEAMLTTSIAKIRERFPEAEFNVFSYLPEEDKSLVSDTRVHIFSAKPLTLVFYYAPLVLVLGPLVRIFSGLKFLLPKSLQRLSESKAFIDLAGVSFVDGREIFILFNLFTLLPAFILGVPVFKFAQALGPFHSSLNRRMAKLFLPLVERIYARGELTWKGLETLGLRKDLVKKSADVAFLHRPEYALSREISSESQAILKKIKSSKKKWIGICPSSVVYKKSQKSNIDYIEVLEALIRNLNRKGYSILLYPNATRGRHSGLFNNDFPVIRELLSRLGEMQNLESILTDVNTAELKLFIGEMDINIVSRFHAMVASLSLSVPCLVLGWSHKYLEVMEMLDQSESVLDYKNLDPNLLFQRIEKNISLRAQNSRKIKSLLPKVEKLSEVQFLDLFTYLK